MPTKYHQQEYASRFAHEARIGLDQVGPATCAATAAVARHVTAGQLTTVLAQLPRWPCEVLGLDAVAASARERNLAGQETGEGDAASAVGAPGGLDRRVAGLESEVRVLAAGLETIPLAEPGDDTGALAARRAHQILLATTEPRG